MKLVKVLVWYRNGIAVVDVAEKETDILLAAVRLEIIAENR